jgi:phosphosulfolactate synthase
VAELEFLELPRRGGKPRTNGLTLVRDCGLGLTDVRDALASYGEYLDYVKIRQFLLWYTDSAVVREKIRVFAEADVVPFPGGTVIEAAHLRGMVPRTMEALKELGFGALELSENVVELSDQQKVELITLALDHDFEVFFEFGTKYDEDAIDVDYAAGQVEALLEAGATKIILERSQLDATIGPRGDFATAGRLVELAERVGVDNLVFEAETVDHQVWLILEFGSEVNLGPNIDPYDVVKTIEPSRAGMGRPEGYTLFAALGAEHARSR